MTVRPDSIHEVAPPARGWFPILLALSSFFLGSLLVDLAVPPETRGNIGAAHRVFREQAGEIDIVFIGSSRVQAGVDVQAMEDEWQKSGAELRAFNFGVPGMRTLEQGHVLRQVLALRTERLRWVVLEALPIGITIRKSTDYSRRVEAISARSISWHTTQVTRRALAAIWRFSLPWSERIDLARHHLGLWARHVSNLGLLSERLFESTSAREQRASGKEEPCRAAEPDAPAVEDPGFGPVLGATEPGATQKERARAKVLRRWNEQSAEQYQQRAARIPAENELPVDLAELDLEVVAERVREARAAGVELIFMTLPCEVGSPEVLRLHEAGLLGPLLHFNDPERYPELFAQPMREGLGHLNAPGAQAFSRLFAREFLELLK